MAVLPAENEPFARSSESATKDIAEGVEVAPPRTVWNQRGRDRIKKAFQRQEVRSVDLVHSFALHALNLLLKAVEKGALRRTGERRHARYWVGME
jgi:hypothetical protein